MRSHPQHILRAARVIVHDTQPFGISRFTESQLLNSYKPQRGLPCLALQLLSGHSVPFSPTNCFSVSDAPGPSHARAFALDIPLWVGFSSSQRLSTPGSSSSFGFIINSLLRKSFLDSPVLVVLCQPAPAYVTSCLVKSMSCVLPVSPLAY